MDIDTRELRVVINRLLDHIIETRGIEKVSLDENFYWNVPEEQAYDMNATIECDVGSLEDEWEFVSSLLDPDSDPVAYQLTEVAPIIRRIGEVLGKQLAGEGG